MNRILILTLLGAATLSAADNPFVPLFDGKSLKGWEVCNGKATYAVEKGEIVGTTVEGSPNSFLCSKKEFGDFVLEFDTKTDPLLNSGVQIRAHRYPKETVVTTFDGAKSAQHTQPQGRVYGYQVEVADEKSGASGGIYDEARRGWLDNIASNPTASKAFKDNEWNHYRIEAVGDSIRTWINGVPCANLTDSEDLSGFIGLQVHAYKGPKPVQVRWKNIRIQDNGSRMWKPLWDGKTLTGWTPRGGGSITVQDGTIYAHSVEGDEKIGMLVSDLSLTDFTVRLKFKIQRGNSGFFVRTDPKNLAAYEVEIDEKKGTGGFWETGPGGRKWVTGPEDNGTVKPNDWNQLTASLHGHRIVFHVNGARTLYLPDDTPGRTEGVLGLQTHGSKKPTDVWFKDIELLVPKK
jgi:hypothetical protein